MRIVPSAAPAVAKPAAMMPPTRDDRRGFGEVMAEAEDAAPEKDEVSSDDKAPMPIEMPSVMQLLPPPTGGRAGVGGEDLVAALSTSDSAAVSVPDTGVDGDPVVPGLGPSPQPSPRKGEGVFVTPVVTIALPSAPPSVGVAEAAIREQVAALVAGDYAPDVVTDVPDADPVAVAVSPTAILSQVAAPSVPALSADAALGLHVAAARHGQAMDGIARDIMAANGSGDGPVRFRMEPATLGAVTVELARGQDGLSIRIETRDAGARDAIVDQQPRLMTDARAAGVQIAAVQVEARREDVASSSSYSQPQGNGQGQAGGNAGGQSGGQTGGQAGQQQRPVPLAGWTRTPPGAADKLSRPGAVSELYA